MIKGALHGRILRFAVKLNRVILNYALALIMVSAVALIGLVAGATFAELVAVCGVLLAATLVATIASRIIRQGNRLINAKLRELEEKQIERSRAARERSEIEFWENLTFGDALDDDALERFLEQSEYARLAYQNGGGIYSGIFFRWFCQCATDFYKNKNLDISELLIVDFHHRLYLDDFTKEFFEAFWMNYFLEEYSKLNAFATLQIAYHFSRRKPFEPYEVADDIGLQNSKQSEEEWADILDEVRKL